MEAAGDWTSGVQPVEDVQSDEHCWFSDESSSTSPSMSARSNSASGQGEWAVQLQAPWHDVALPAGQTDTLHKKRSREEDDSIGPAQHTEDHPSPELAELKYREARVLGPLVDPSAIYWMICDPSKHHSARPGRITAVDGGRLFLESASGQPGKVKKERRAKRKGQDTWNQHDSLWMKVVAGVVPARGHAPAGTVWVSARYGDVNCHQAPSTEDGGESLQQKTFHMFDLFFFTGDPGSVPSAWVSAGVPRKERKSFASRCTWQQGTLYHLPWAPEGVAISESPGSHSHESTTAVPPPVWPSSDADLHQSTAPVPVRATEMQSCSGRVDLQLADGDKRWLRMSDESGKERGVLQLGDGGHIELVGTSGDFAEYHQRDPSESPFEEGDIVAFGAHGLTRKTTAARQLGVISRRAIVKGSRPADPAAMSDFDAVAYMGIVPVKLRGPAYRDDYVVPSGKHDGTGVAVSGFPSANVGRIYGITLQDGKRKSSFSDYEKRWGRWCCKCRMLWERRQAWVLTPIVVQNPVGTVSGARLTWRRSIAVFATVLLAGMIAACLLLSPMGLTNNKHDNDKHKDNCGPMTLDHGTVRGEGSSCTFGAIGSRCSYMTCDLGYALQPSSVAKVVISPSVEAWSSAAAATTDSSGPNTTVLQVEQQCEAPNTTLSAEGKHTSPRWSGPGGTLHCVRQWCGEESVDMYELGLCEKCDGEVPRAPLPALITFPRTAAAVSKEPEAAVVVSVNCPEHYIGSASRTCGGHTEGWGATTGRCTPKIMPGVLPCCCDVPGGETKQSCTTGPPRCPYDCGTV